MPRTGVCSPLPDRQLSLFTRTTKQLQTASASAAWGTFTDTLLSLSTQGPAEL